MEINLAAIDPVAFEIGPFAIRWYALSYLAGILLGWRYMLVLAGRRANERPHKDDIDDFISWAIIGIILGGRLGYVLFYNFDYYMMHPQDILKVWHGGMSFHGGMTGVLIAMYLFALRVNVPFLKLADFVTAAAPIGLFFGRIANFINGELYGRVTDVSWGVVFPRGGDAPRHPSQLYEAGLEGALLFAVLYICMRTKLREAHGFCAGVFMAGYGAARIVVELFRQPDAQVGFVFAHVSMGQVLSLPMVLIGLSVCVYAWRKGGKNGAL